MTSILLVEDEPTIRSLYETALKAAGFIVTSAIDGEDALTKATAGGYDLILLDLMLPKMDGITVIKKLKENPPVKPNGEIVLLTNLIEEHVLEEAKSLGINTYLSKETVSPSSLCAKVNEITAGSPTS